VTPSGVEARKRIGAGGKEILIVVNHERAEKLVRLPWPAREHLSSQPLIDEMRLTPFGVAVLTQLDG
jgi:hypothetical protein